MKKKHKYISQVNNSYRVRFNRNKIIICCKYFGIGKYANKQEALKAAIKYRDRELKRHGLLHRLKYTKTPDEYRANKKLACIGVYFTTKVHAYGICSNWTARTMNNGVEVKRHFSINKYGYEKAFQMACKVRHKHSGPIRVISPKLLPEKPKVPYRLSS